MNLRSASGRRLPWVSIWNALVYFFQTGNDDLEGAPGRLILLLPRHHPDGQHHYDDCDELE